MPNVGLANCCISEHKANSKTRVKLFCLKSGESETTQRWPGISNTQWTQNCRVFASDLLISLSATLCCETWALFSCTVFSSCFSHRGDPLLRIAYTLRMKFTKQGEKPGVREREENAIKSKKCESIASFTVTALHIQAVTMSSFETYCICCL